MGKNVFLILTAFFFHCSFLLAESSNSAIIKGRVVTKKGKNPIEFATVAIQNTTTGTTTDIDGRFEFKTPSGEVVLVIQCIGFETLQKKVNIKQNANNEFHFEMSESAISIDEVVVHGESKSTQINKTAFNVQSLSLDELKNSTLGLSGALSKMEGIRIRESGGIGSDAQISLNGFSGSHVKIFIDGVPQDNSGAFSINNIPANFAERIEVYSGVVPIEFGSDALGGVINIVTGKEKKHRSLWLDASYSYGSFNTHKTYVDFGQQFDNGFTYSINAYQNFSDNNYYVDEVVKKFLGDGGSFMGDEKERVQRFNDQYHNESIIGKVGIIGKEWADELFLDFNYSQYYKEIQTGSVQSKVYGEKFRRGQSFIPALRYSKRDLFAENLDVRLDFSYNRGYTQNIDTTAYEYNWAGEKQLSKSISDTHNEVKNNLLTGNFIAKYALSDMHEFTVSHMLNSTSRSTRSIIAGTNLMDDYTRPQLSMKNISGVSYRIRPSEKWNATLFAKNYVQANEGLVDSDDDGNYDAIEFKHNSSQGYGAAATYHMFSFFQSKLSFERAYRLPTSRELFGDGDLEFGNFELRPEQSYNYNLNLTFRKNINNSHLFFDLGLIYRNTTDYIRRTVNPQTGTSGFDNHGKVETKGFNITARYDYSKLFSVGASLNSLNARDGEDMLSSSGSQVSLTAGQRIPNQPYLYANGDAALNFYDLIKKEDSFSIIYDLMYQHEFSLYWENLGSEESRIMVPEQIAHNVTLNYSLEKGKYNLSLECRNLTDSNLYDNFSLQKPGRAFYVKLRVNFSQYK